MNLDEAIAIVKDHNVWRRTGDSQTIPLFHQKYPDDYAKKLGIAIDVVLQAVEGLA
jgi:hypothetical protein